MIVKKVKTEDGFVMVTNVPWKGKERPKQRFNEAYARDRRWMEKNQGLIATMSKTVDQMLGSGIMKEVDKDQVRHYVPYRVVIKEEHGVTTKFRVTMDMRDFNEFTNKGDLEPEDLRKTIQAFRANRYVLSSDLRQAFWQVRLEGEEGDIGTVILGRTFALNRLPFGANFSSSAMALAMRLVLPRGVACYVVNLVCNAATTASMEKKANEMFEAVTKAGFQVNWEKTFSNGLIITSGGVERDDRDEEYEILGYGYSMKNDTITRDAVPIGQMELQKYMAKPQWTRWDVRHVSSSYFDPLGLFSRVGAFYRWAQQKAIMETKTEEDFVTTELTEKLKKFLWTNRESKMEVERRFQVGQVYGFCDASDIAWCVEYRDRDLKKIASFFGVWSESDRKRSIPAKELQALKKAIECVDRIGVTSSKVEIFSDSSATLWRLKRPKNDELLEVKDRRAIRKARQGIDEKRITVRFIRSGLNLADQATRPLDVIKNDEVEVRKWIKDRKKRPDMPVYVGGQENESEKEDDDDKSTTQDPDTEMEIPELNQVEVVSMGKELENEIKKAQREDVKKVPEWMTKHIKNEGGWLKFKDKILITRNEIAEKIVKLAHDAQHGGRDKMEGLLSGFEISGVGKKIAKVIDRCEACDVVRN